MRNEFESFEQGWPARDFDEDARAYLLQEGRQRVQEQLGQLRSYDVKIAALFTASAGLFALSGFLGTLTLDDSPAAILTLLALFASLIAWILLGVAYCLRETGTGLEMQAVRQNYAGASKQELQDTALESYVEDFILNRRTLRSKARWLTWSLVAVGAQLLLLFAATIANAEDNRTVIEKQSTQIVEGSASGAVPVDRAR